MQGVVEITSSAPGGEALTDPWGDYLVRHNIICSRLSWLVVDSGYFEHENPEIHRLSLVLIRLVTFNFLVAVAGFWSVVTALHVTGKPESESTMALKDAVVLTLLHLALFRASVRAIQTRNKPCCCGLSYMAAFQIAYINAALYVAAILCYHALIHPCDHYQTAITLGLLASLISLTVAAEYARRLRRVLPPSPDHTAPKKAVDNAIVIVEEEYVGEDRKEQPRGAYAA